MMRFRKPVEMFFWIVASLTILGTILRFTIRDYYSGFATLYYMTPLAMLVIGAGVVLARQVYLHDKRFARFWGGLLLFLFVWWIQVDWRSHIQPKSTNDEIVVLLANIARDQNVSKITDKVQKFNPDIICFIEALAMTSQQRKQWETVFPDHQWSMIDGGTQLFAKGTISSPWVNPLPDGTRLSRSVITLNGEEIHCFTVDIASTIYRPRKPPIDGLVNFLENSERGNVLILGDFNTPTDSVHFAGLRKDFENLFDSVGNGYAPTWPAPVPVLTLDQIWIGETLEPIGCRLISNLNSDHKMVLGRFRIKEQLSP